MNEQPSPRQLATTAARMGATLRHMRKLQGKTLRSIAERVGCSVSMLSKIELGRATPSLDLLAKLAEEMGTSIAELFGKEGHRAVAIYGSGERPTIDLGEGAGREGGQSTLERLIPYEHGRQLNANLHVVPPGGGSAGTLSHTGEEVGYVIDGFIELTIDGQASLLGPGASFFFSSVLPHSYRNIGREVARIVWVNSPPY